MSEKWTKTSSPFSRSMKPNPFSGLNHFTTPDSTLSPSPKPFSVGYHTRQLVSTEPSARLRPTANPAKPIRDRDVSRALQPGTAPCGFGEKKVRVPLTWSLAPHSPAESLQPRSAVQDHAHFSPLEGAGLTPKPHHAQQPLVALRGSFRLRLASTFNHRPRPEHKLRFARETRMMVTRRE